jgi:hypothetical protein
MGKRGEAMNTDDDRAIAEALGWTIHKPFFDPDEIPVNAPVPIRWWKGRQSRDAVPTLETDRAMQMDAVKWLASRGTLGIDVYDNAAMVAVAEGDGYLKESIAAALRAAMLWELGR